VQFLIVDDHPLLRRGVKEILQDAYPDAGIGEAASAAEMFAKLRTQAWDLLVLDVSLPDLDGLECLAQIKRGHPALPVLIMSAHAEALFAIPALKAGASGYLHKERAPEDLLNAIGRVLRGGKYVSSEVAELLAEEQLQGTTRPLHESLSEREFTIMRLLAGGRAVSEIAEQLYLSPKTVTTYRARLLQKMNLTSNAELAQYCVRKGLLT
jgi:two-component system, NarL family, invasion response regulator UvrY